MNIKTKKKKQENIIRLRFMQMRNNDVNFNGAPPFIKETESWWSD